MNYSETLEWMFSRLPMYQMQGQSAYRKDLTNTIKLLDYLSHPELNQSFIHVGGTNGKGSTSHMLASVFQEAGYKVGLYTSPHLKDYRERIKINGNEIDAQFVVDFINKHKLFFETNSLSFFEMTVGLAYQYFFESKTDINIIEVGMGGRLDSTNTINPIVSVITNIGLDHTQFLGDTLEKIAFEKAGIIKNNTPVVIGEYGVETKDVFLKKALETNSALYFASEFNYPSHNLPLEGNYQQKNVKTVLKTIEVIHSVSDFVLSEEAIDIGLKNVLINTGFRGRWQKLNDAPLVICDTAHNGHGLVQVLQQISQQKYEQLHIVIGMVNDKEIDTIISLFPKEALYYFCKPNIPRGLDQNILRDRFHSHQLFGKVYDSVSEAYSSALKSATRADMIFIGGSTFVVAEIL